MPNRRWLASVVVVAAEPEAWGHSRRRPPTSSVTRRSWPTRTTGSYRSITTPSTRSRRSAAARCCCESPDTAGRYYVLQFVDAWTNYFAYVGRRATGTEVGTFLLIPS